MSGTPMMNNVGELYSLIHFLRIKPYNESEQFNRVSLVNPVGYTSFTDLFTGLYPTTERQQPSRQRPSYAKITSIAESDTTPTDQEVEDRWQADSQPPRKNNRIPARRV